MMVEELKFLQEQSPTRITKDVLGGLEPEESELLIVPLEVGEEVGTRARATNEVQEDKGFEVEDEVREAIKVESGDNEVP